MAELTEVLRCKDCLFRMRTDWNSRAYYCSYQGRSEIVTAYDYCSKGIRKEACVGYKHGKNCHDNVDACDAYVKRMAELEGEE